MTMQVNVISQTCSIKNGIKFSWQDLQMNELYYHLLIIYSSAFLEFTPGRCQPTCSFSGLVFINKEHDIKNLQFSWSCRVSLDLLKPSINVSVGSFCINCSPLAFMLLGYKWSLWILKKSLLSPKMRFAKCLFFLNYI